MANIQALLKQVQRVLGQAPSSGTGLSTLLPLLVTSGGTTCRLAQGAGHAGGENTIFYLFSQLVAVLQQVTLNPQIQVLYTYKVRIIPGKVKSVYALYSEI